jgi:hypothetical protein
VIVVERAWERFDEPTALWCFDHLASSLCPSWLSQRRQEWEASGASWAVYLSNWARGHGLHPSDVLHHALDQRFERVLLEGGPYSFPDRAGVGQADEQRALDAGTIRATASRYVGRLPWLGEAARARTDRS